MAFACLQRRRTSPTQMLPKGGLLGGLAVDSPFGERGKFLWEFFSSASVSDRSCAQSSRPSSSPQAISVPERVIS